MKWVTFSLLVVIVAVLAFMLIPRAGCEAGDDYDSYSYHWRQEGHCQNRQSHSSHTDRKVSEHHCHHYQHMTPHTQGPMASLWVNILGVVGLDARVNTFTHVPGPQHYYGAGCAPSAYGRTYSFSHRRPSYGGGVYQSWTPSCGGSYRVRHHYGVGCTQYPVPRQHVNPPLRRGGGLHLQAGPSRHSGPAQRSGAHLQVGPSRHSQPSRSGLHLHAGPNR